MEDCSLPNIIRKVIGPPEHTLSASQLPEIYDPYLQKHEKINSKIKQIIYEAPEESHLGRNIY